MSNLKCLTTLCSVVGILVVIHYNYAVPKNLMRLKTIPSSAALDGLFIGANYHNNAKLLQGHHLPELMNVLNTLLLSNISVYVSIYESGSTDSTPAVLASFGEWLIRQNVPHRIITGENATVVANHKNTAVRIESMAKVRNKVMEPLAEGSHITKLLPSTNHTRVLFLNDIKFRAADVFELLLRTNEESSYDVACAMDFDPIWFYDTWVSRTTSGQLMSSYYPYFHHPTDVQMMRKMDSVPVYSCWNGMVVLPLSPFTNNGLHFRSWTEGTELRSPILSHNDTKVYSNQCAVSECQLIMKDLYVLNYRRVYINPRVRVTYHINDARLLTILGPFLDFWADWFLVPKHFSEEKDQPLHVACGNAMAMQWSLNAYRLPILIGFLLIILLILKARRKTLQWLMGLLPLRTKEQ